MDKNGLSAVITTLILIAISFALVAIVWSIVNTLVKDNLETTEACFGNFEKVIINSLYTNYDPLSNYFQFSINIKDVHLDKLFISISEESGITKTFIITEEEQQIENLANYGSDGFGVDQIKLPGENAGLSYVTNYFSEKPSSMEISSVINKRQCGIVDSLYEIDFKTF
jgi:flagellin-like protein